MNIVWLAPYPIDQLQPSITLKDKHNKGTGQWLVHLSNELVKSNSINLTIITHSANVFNDEIITINGITFIVLKHTFPFMKKGYPYYFRIDVLFRYYFIVKKTINLIKKINPDLIHVHGTENAYGLIPSKLKNIPSIISIQGIIGELYKTERTMFFYLQKKIELFTLKNNINFGFRTEWDKEYILNKNRLANLFYMPEAINKIYFEQNWSLKNDLILTFVGAVVKRKGVEDIIYALNSIKRKYVNIKLQIIGSGLSSYLLKLQKLIKELDLEENIVFLGFKNPDEIAKILSKSKLFILPSYSDNSPNSLCEAMAVGVPSVVYATGGIPSLIGKDNGILVETGKKEQLADKIITLLSDDKKMIDLSSNAKKTALKRNHPNSASVSTLNVYTELLKKQNV